MHRHGRGRWCSPAHRRTRRSLLSTHRRERQWNNESKITIHAPAWTRMVVCAGTPKKTRLSLLSTHRRKRQWNNESKVTIHAPAWTRVVVCAGTTKKRDDRYCLRTGVNDSGTTSRKVLSTHRRGRCLLYTSPSPRDKRQSRMPSSA